MRVLLVPVSDRPESKTALKVTMGLADRLDAHIVGCHLRPHRDTSKGYKGRGFSLFGNSDSEALDELGRKTTESATRKAQKTFEDLVTGGGFELIKKPTLNMGRAASWQERVGMPEKLMAILGPVSDLCVVSRPSSKGKVARLFMLAAVLHTGRPVLIVPAKQTRAPGRHIAIAWNQGPEVARVVAACMPLIQTAEHVSIITCGPEDRPGPKARQLLGYLKCHGVQADIIAKKGHADGSDLEATYKESGADCLLMGAYSRARFREMIFGGMTQHMLFKSKIPVIVQHG